MKLGLYCILSWTQWSFSNPATDTLFPGFSFQGYWSECCFPTCYYCRQWVVNRLSHIAFDILTGGKLFVLRELWVRPKKGKSSDGADADGSSEMAALMELQPLASASVAISLQAFAATVVEAVGFQDYHEAGEEETGRSKTRPYPEICCF